MACHKHYIAAFCNDADVGAGAIENGFAMAIEMQTCRLERCPAVGEPRSVG